MNYRNVLTTTFSLLSLLGVLFPIIILFQSLGPSANAGSTLPRIDISGMQNGSYQIETQRYGYDYFRDIFVLKDFDSSLYVFDVVRGEPGYIMPDLTWRRWGGFCREFRPETKDSLLVQNGTFKCHDERITEWQSNQWKWTYQGLSVNGPHADMEQLNYVIEGNYVVVGKTDNS